MAPYRLKWSTIYTVDIRTAKTNSNTGYSQPRHLPSAWNHHSSLAHHCEFTPCYNQPWVGRLKFRLEINSTLVWLYMLVVSVWFCLMCDLERSPKIGSCMTGHQSQLLKCRTMTSKILAWTCQGLQQLAQVSSQLPAFHNWIPGQISEGTLSLWSTRIQIQ